MQKEAGRKTRSDKKRPVAPYVSAEVFEVVSQISYISDLPMKTIGERIFRDGIQSRALLESISGLFRRDFARTEGHMYIGNLEREPYKDSFEGEKKRLHMRMYAFEHGRLAELAFALDSSLQTAAGLIIKTAVSRKDILYPLLGQMIIRELDPQRQCQLKSLSRFLDARSTEAYVTTPMVMSHIIIQSLSDQQKISKSLSQLLG